MELSWFYTTCNFTRSTNILLFRAIRLILSLIYYHPYKMAWTFNKNTSWCTSIPSLIFCHTCTMACTFKSSTSWCTKNALVRTAITRSLIFGDWSMIPLDTGIVISSTLTFIITKDKIFRIWNFGWISWHGIISLKQMRMVPLWNCHR